MIDTRQTNLVFHYQAGGHQPSLKKLAGKVHSRAKRLGTTHIIPACQMGQGKRGGWFSSDDFSATKALVTCKTCNQSVLGVVVH